MTAAASSPVAFAGAPIAAGTHRESALSPRLILVLASKELRDALRNRWFLLYAVCFAALSMALASLALAGTGKYGLAGFGRTAASLINLVLFIVPLMALTAGATALAAERERGTLETLLAQPLHRVEVLLAKFFGLAVALLGSLTVGFGATAMLLASQGRVANLGPYLAIFGLSVLLAWSMLSIGLLISSFSRRTSIALGIAIFTWLALVFLGDLGLMGGALALKLSADELLAVALVNPLQVFKLFAVSQIHGSLDLLGPAGLYATQSYGSWLRPLLGGVLTLWIVLPLTVAGVRFSSGGVR